ncbi:MAG: RNA polymerase sigma factor RpoD/SigA [Fibrobacteres bacterium]|nr:RNA polymerase sigma factor RpoD/SigA [Fibrobacterota bacterium]
MNQEPVARNSVSPKPVKRTERLEFVEGGDRLSTYFKEIKAIKGLTLAEERALSDRIRTGDNLAVKTLVEANLKFVVAVCRNYQNQGLSMGDLISEGNLGLMRAARRYDGSMNFKFISYAVWWIRQGILTALAEQTRVLNVPTGRVEVLRTIGKTNRKLAQTLGRLPSSVEVAEEMGVAEAEVEACLFLANPSLSLSRPVAGDEEGGYEHSLPDSISPKTDASSRSWMVAKAMQSMLGVLTDRESLTLKMFYGIDREDNLTLTDIASRFGVTRERVRQIKADGLRKLRHPAREERLNALRNPPRSLTV